MGNWEQKDYLGKEIGPTGESSTEGTPGKMTIWYSETNPSLHETLVITFF